MSIKQGPDRDVGIDVLRGLCLVSMTLGHVTYAIGATSAITQLVHIPLFVDGAAGFVFLSGVSVALSDTARLRKGQTAAARRNFLLQRAVFIFAVHVVLTLAAIIYFDLMGAPSWSSPRTLSWETVAGVLSFDSVVSFMNVLPLYVVFLLVTPLALRSRSRRAQRIVATVSVGVFAFSQFRPEWTMIRSGADQDPTWVLGSWQILFFGGLMAGIHWDRIRTVLSRDVHRRAFAAVGALSALTLVGFRAAFIVSERTNLFGGSAWRQWLEEEALAKSQMGPLLVLLCVGFGIGAYIAVTLVVETFGRLALPLELMGAKSLRIYLGSCVLVLLYVGAAAAPPQAWTAEATAVLAVLALAVLARFPVNGRGHPWSI